MYYEYKYFAPFCISTGENVDKLFGLKEKQEAKERKIRKSVGENLPPQNKSKSRDKLGIKAKVSGRQFGKGRCLLIWFVRILRSVILIFMILGNLLFWLVVGYKAKHGLSNSLTIGGKNTVISMVVILFLILIVASPSSYPRMANQFVMKQLGII